MNRTVVFNPVFTRKSRERLLPYSVVPRWMEGLPPKLVELMVSQFGAASAWTLTNAARKKLLDGTFDIDTGSYKMALFLSTSDLGLTSTTYAGVSNEVATAYGYTETGMTVALTLTNQGDPVGSEVKCDITTDPVWTASGGSITARFATIYQVAGDVLCYCLLDSAPADVTATDGNTLTVAAHASGVFTLA